MNKYSLILLTVLFVSACTSLPPTEAPQASLPPVETSPAVQPANTLDTRAVFFQITSPAFISGLPIPPRYSCDGENISPALTWTEPPVGTQSFVLIMDDPDAFGSTWTHWVIYNIPAESRGLPEAVPTGPQFEDGSLQAITSTNTTGYHGPCPPSGTHHYIFKLYALDKILSLDSNAKKEDVTRAMEAHILANAELMGTFSR
jgi:Raf kinase inhibitor-like YbhB/YbcL family protein